MYDSYQWSCNHENIIKISILFVPVSSLTHTCGTDTDRCFIVGLIICAPISHWHLQASRFMVHNQARILRFWQSWDSVTTTTIVHHNILTVLHPCDICRNSLKCSNFYNSAARLVRWPPNFSIFHLSCIILIFHCFFRIRQTYFKLFQVMFMGLSY